MRFAVLATAAAAVVAVPLAVEASGPQMSPAQFVDAVRCTAFAQVFGEDEGAARLRLNAEARRQTPAVAALAHNEVKSIARRAAAFANDADAAMMRAEQAQACAAASAMV